MAASNTLCRACGRQLHKSTAGDAVLHASDLGGELEICPDDTRGHDVVLPVVDAGPGRRLPIEMVCGGADYSRG